LRRDCVVGEDHRAPRGAILVEERVLGAASPMPSAPNFKATRASAGVSALAH
jgi:hypothetical protein